jgi:hypothetical protein
VPGWLLWLANIGYVLHLGVGPVASINVISQISVISALLSYVDIVLSINFVKIYHHQINTHP